MHLSSNHKRLLRNLATVSVASAAAGVGAVGMAPALAAGAAGQGLLLWLNRADTTLSTQSETTDLVPTLTRSLRTWAQTELNDTNDIELTEGLKLAIAAIATHGLGWDGLAQASFNPSKMADQIIAAAMRDDAEWAHSEQARFVIAAQAIKSATASLATAARRNEPAFMAAFAILTERIGTLQQQLNEMEDRGAQVPVALHALRESSRRARADLAPETLPLIDRTDLIDLALARPLDQGPLVVIGDGGLGKSVFAGQLYDKLAASGDETVLVPCSQVPRAASLATATDVERAFCQAATGLDDVPGLLATLQGIDQSTPVTVVIDTVDLILNEVTARPVAVVLQRLSDEYRLVVLCREREWVDFNLGAALRTATTLSLPRLTPPEIITWAQHFVDTAKTTSPLFLDSVKQAARAGGGSEVLGVPLRLAMACELYAERAAIPDDLTVSVLYRSYWDRRIARDREGIRGDLARAQEVAALAVAAAIWDESRQRFVESARPVGVVDWAALDRLRGEGVLREVAGRLRFFHQTFGEFAVAQHLIASATGDDLDRLRERLRDNDSGMWGVANYLLPAHLGKDRYDTLAEAISPDLSKGMRLRLRGALEQPSDECSTHLVRTLAAAHPEEVAIFADLFNAVGPGRRRMAAAVLLDLVVTQTNKLNRLADVAASLTLTLDTQARAEMLAPAISTLATQRPVPAERLNPVLTRLLAGFPTPTDPHDLAVLTSLYRHLPDPARGQILEIASAQDGLETNELLTMAMRLELPTKSADHGATLLTRAWQDAKWRNAHAWSGWRDLLLAELPNRWASAQTRATVDVVALDEEMFTQLLIEALHPTQTTGRPRIHNAAEFLATHWPDKTAEVALGHGIAPTRVAVATASTLMRRLADAVPDQTRENLATMLWERRNVDPQTALPALVRLLANTGDSFGRLEAEMRHRFTNTDTNHDRTRWNCFDALTQTLQPTQLLTHYDLARLLCQGQHQTDLINSATLEALLAPLSPQARTRCHTLILQDQRTTRVTACARTLHEHSRTWDTSTLDTIGIPWLVTLIRTPVPKAVEHLAATINTRIDTAHWEPAMTNQVVNRLISSLNKDDDLQVADKLRNILIGAARRETPTITPQHVRKIVSAYWTALTRNNTPNRANHAATLWAGLNSTTTALAFRIYDHNEQRSLLERIVLTDSSRYSNRSTRYTAQTVTSYLQADPTGLAHIEQLWDSMPPIAQTAVSEALDRGWIPGKHATAQRLLNLGAANATAARLLNIVETGGSRTQY